MSQPTPWPHAYARSETALTERQAEILRHIRARIAEDGFAPSLRELMTAFRIGSMNAVNDHLRALEKKGFIRRRALTARAIVVTALGKTEPLPIAEPSTGPARGVHGKGCA